MFRQPRRLSQKAFKLLEHWMFVNVAPNVRKNRSFPSSRNSHFQNEAKCETFVVKMSFICIIIKNHFHINGFAVSLALKARFFGTRKWPNFVRLTQAFQRGKKIILSTIGPLQLAIHVVQSRHAGEQKSHWDKTNKRHT